MRGVVLIVAAAAAMFTTTAYADVISQFDTNHSEFRDAPLFQPFDAALGTLNGVTLQVDVNDYREIDVLPGDNSPIDLSWVVNGVRLVGTPGGQFEVPLYGAGSAAGVTVGGITFRVTGTATASLDPAGFLVGNYFRDNLISIGSFDRAFYTNEDIVVTTDHPERIMLHDTNCPGLDEFCNRVNYRLSYDYTPFPSLPEPSTWATMLVGFGAIGLQMRRKCRTATAQPS